MLKIDVCPVFPFHSKKCVAFFPSFSGWCEPPTPWDLVCSEKLLVVKKMVHCSSRFTQPSYVLTSGNLGYKISYIGLNIW